MVEALTDMLSKLIVGGKSQADFDLDAFTARVMRKDQYRAVSQSVWIRTGSRSAA